MYTVPAAGGTPTVRLPIDPKTDVEFTTVSPLADGRLIVTTFLRDSQAFRTDLVSAGPDGRRTTLVADPDVTSVKADRSGALLFRRRGSNQGIWAAPFDGTRVDLGRSVVIAPRGGSFQADAVGNAVIALLPPLRPTELVWMTERGEVTPLPGVPVPGIAAHALSPDGRHVAFIVDAEGDRHLLVRNRETGSDARLTPAGAEEPTLQSPSWFPSSDEVVFATGPAAIRRVVSRRLDGSGGLRVLATARLGQITPDGRYLVLVVDESGQRRLRYAPLDTNGTVGALGRVLQGADPEVFTFDVSRDGSMLAYSISEADGLLNTFLTDFPGGSRQVQVTTRGGGRPKFSIDGTTVFYLTRVPDTESLGGGPGQTAARPTAAGAAWPGDPAHHPGTGAARRHAAGVRDRARRTLADDADRRREPPRAAAGPGAELASRDRPLGAWCVPTLRPISLPRMAPTGSVPVRVRYRRPGERERVLCGLRHVDPIWSKLTPAASLAIRKGNYMRLFDEGRPGAGVEQANLR